MQHLEQYISDEVVEVIKKLSTAANAEELKNSISVAQELRESVAAVVTTTNDRKEEELIGDALQNAAQVEQANLAQQLQRALSALQVVAIESAGPAPDLNENVLQKIVEVITQLNEDLSVVTTAQVLVQQPPIPVPIEEAEEVKHTEVAESTIESSNAMAAKTVAIVEEITSVPETVDDQPAQVKTVDQIDVSESIHPVVLEQALDVEEKLVPNDEYLTSATEDVIISNEQVAIIASETISRSEMKEVSGPAIEITQPTVLEEVAINEKDSAAAEQAVYTGKMRFRNFAIQKINRKSSTDFYGFFLFILSFFIFHFIYGTAK